MKFGLKSPCKDCPFRTDREGYLRPGRIEGIVHSLVAGHDFACHKTTVDAEDEDGSERVETEDSQHCAGALIFLEKAGYAPPQLARIAERVGEWEPGGMVDKSVAGSLTDLIEQHGGEVNETCGVCDVDCEAPAGMLVGGVAVAGMNAEGVDLRDCTWCGTETCESCACRWEEGNTLCNYCEGKEE